MIVTVLTVRLYAPWVHSLKEKRREVQSLTRRLRNHFNVAVAEIDEQDLHQTLVLGLTGWALDRAGADRQKEQWLRFIEDNTQAQVISAEMELL